MVSPSIPDPVSSPVSRERIRIRRFFNRTAFLYPLIERHLAPRYRRALERLRLSPRLSVLDAGTGSGTLAAAFYRRGHAVTGLDFSQRLLRTARRRYPGITFREFDLVHLDGIRDNSFDLVSAGHLLHGLSPVFRVWILGQFARISRRYVMIMDYASGGGWLVRLIERIEGSHYPEFITSSRKGEFDKAGLKMALTFPTSDFGRVWLCRPSGTLS